MRPKRIRWLGPTRYRQLLEALQAQVRLWAEEWSVTPEKFTVQSLDAGSGQGLADWRWREVECPAGVFRVGAPVSMFDALGNALVQVAVKDDLGLGRRVAERAINALAARLTGDASVVLSLSEAPLQREREERFGGLHARLEGRGFQAMLWLDNDLCDALCPVPRREFDPPLQRVSALGPEAMSLEVVVDLGSATVADASGLRVGEVLVSRTPLESLFHLVTPDGKSIARGRPCRNGPARAVQIEST